MNAFGWTKRRGVGLSCSSGLPWGDRAFEPAMSKRCSDCSAALAAVPGCPALLLLGAHVSFQPLPTPHLVQSASGSRTPSSSVSATNQLRHCQCGECANPGRVQGSRHAPGAVRSACPSGRCAGCVPKGGMSRRSSTLAAVTACMLLLRVMRVRWRRSPLLRRLSFHPRQVSDAAAAPHVSFTLF
jgi:hypothetical protein